MRLTNSTAMYDYSSQAPVMNWSDARKTLVVVCTSDKKQDRFGNDDQMYWRWKGIHESDILEPMFRRLKIANILIV